MSKSQILHHLTKHACTSHAHHILKDEQNY